MALKGNYPMLDKVAEDEPIFVLRAQDELAPLVVRIWTLIAQSRGVGGSKFTDASACATEMEMWQKKHGCKVPD